MRNVVTWSRVSRHPCPRSRRRTSLLGSRPEVGLRRSVTACCRVTIAARGRCSMHSNPLLATPMACATTRRLSSRSPKGRSAPTRHAPSARPLRRLSGLNSSPQRGKWIRRRCGRLCHRPGTGSDRRARRTSGPRAPASTGTGGCA